MHKLDQIVIKYDSVQNKRLSVYVNVSNETRVLLLGELRETVMKLATQRVVYEIQSSSDLRNTFLTSEMI